MDRMCILLALCLCVSGFARAGEPAAGEQAGRQLIAAYTLVIAAEGAEARRDLPAAIRDYTRAIDAYETLQTQYPGWERDAIALRLADCRNHLARLKRIAPPPTPDPVSNVTVAAEPELRAVDTNAVSSPAQVPAAPVAVTAAEVRAESAELDLLRKDLARVRRERDDALELNNTLLKRNLRLEARLSRMEAREGSHWFWQHGKPPAPAATNRVTELVKDEARRMIREGEPAKAVNLLTDATRSMPDDLSLQLFLATAYCQAGRFDDAVRLGGDLIAENGSSGDARFVLGTAYIGLREYGKARAQLEKAVALDPEHADAHFNLAKVLLWLDPPDVNAAQKYYLRSLQLGGAADTVFEEQLRNAIIISKIGWRRQ